MSISSSVPVSAPAPEAQQDDRLICRFLFDPQLQDIQWNIHMMEKISGLYMCHSTSIKEWGAYFIVLVLKPTLIELLKRDPSEMEEIVGRKLLHTLVLGDAATIFKQEIEDQQKLLGRIKTIRILIATISIVFIAIGINLTFF